MEMMIKLEPELPSTASMVDTFVAACTAGQLEALKWLETKYPNTAVNWSHLLGQAMRNDRLEVMKYIKATKTTTFSTEDLGEVGCSGSYSTIEFVFSHSTRAEMLEVASRGCTVNSEYEVRRWCGQVMESTWVSPTYFLSILNREDYTVAEVEHLVALASVQAAKTPEPVKVVLKADYGILAFFAHSLLMDNARWCFNLAQRVDGSADMEMFTLNLLYKIYSTEHYRFHREDGAYYEECSDKTIFGCGRRRTDFINECLRLCVAYRQASLNTIAWMPTWAVRTQCFKTLEWLEAMQHPFLFRGKSLRAVIKYTRNGSLMLWFLTRAPQLCTPDVSRWAAKYGLQSVLSFLLELFKADQAKHRMLVRSAAMAAAQHGQFKTLQWLWASVRQYWSDGQAVAMLAVPAARGGRYNIAMELHRIAPFEDAVVLRFVMEAVRWRHSAMVKWALTLPCFWELPQLLIAMEFALQLSHMDLVTLLAQKISHLWPDAFRPPAEPKVRTLLTRYLRLQRVLQQI